MHTHSTTGRPERRTKPRSITARNNDARQAGHQAFAEKRINGAADDTYQRVIDYCGTNTYTRAALDTIAASLPGRSAETHGGKSVSSIKGHLRQLVNAGLVWIDELGIHITALEPEPTLIATQPPLPDPDELRTLEMIVNDIKAATDRGDFAAVAQLAAEADTLRDQDAVAAPQNTARAAAANDDLPEPESKNCPDRVKKLPHVNKKINPSVVKQQNFLNPRQAASAACRPHGGDGRAIDRSQKRRADTIPNTDATRLLKRYGVQSPAALRRHCVAQLDVIENARRRQLELDAEPGMIVQILDDNGLVWTTCGQRVDKPHAMPALDDDDAWRERYIGGNLGRYIIGGPTDAPPDVEDAPPSEPERERRDAEHAMIDGWVPPALRPPPTPPATPPDDPELHKYRNSLNVPPWMREGGDA